MSNTPGYHTGKKWNNKPMTDEERQQAWAKKLAEFGYSETASKLIIGYAAKAYSYDLDNRGNRRPFGSAIVTMFCRLGDRLGNKLSSLNLSNIVYALQELEQFLIQKPCGASVTTWRTEYKTNGDQRVAIDTFFGFNGRRITDLSADERTVFMIKDAAWPSMNEEASGKAGTFIERFDLFAKAIMSIYHIGDDTIETLFSPFFKEEEDVRENLNWVVDGHCECGGELTKDADGNTVCKNYWCSHSVAATTTAIPDSFSGFTQQSQEQQPANSPKEHRHEKGPRKDHEREMPPTKKKHNKGPKFRPAQDDEEPVTEASAEAPVQEQPADTSAPSGFSMASAFELAGL